MTSRRLIVSFSIVTLAMLVLYFLIASILLQEPVPFETINRDSTENTDSDDTVADIPGPVADQPNAPPAPQPKSVTQSSRLIEIFGQVLDADGAPIEDVLVTEERYFDVARSDARGNYRLLLELPTHRYPTLNFLRHDYRSKRVKIGQHQLQQETLYRLDLRLDDDPKSVRVSGWVGNDIGGALEGARVELTGLEPSDGDNYYLTVFTDDKGQFTLEGARAGDQYKFSVNLAPQYPLYEDYDFVAQAGSQPLEIVLKSLRFVDIDGMILTRDSVPVPDFEIYVSNVTTGVHSRKIVSDSSGYFSLQNFPLGEVSFTTRGSDFYTISGLVLTDSEYRNLVLTIDRGGHYLSGWILDASGPMTDRVMVTLDKNWRDGAVEYHQYRSQATDSEGKFSFASLGAGEYRVTVYAQGYRKHELRHRLQNQSDEIQIVIERSTN